MAGTLTISTLSDGTNSTSSTNCIQGSAKAWVNFDGTTSPGTIRASYNVSSVTRNGTGDYTINFTNAFVDTNYSVAMTGNLNIAGNNDYFPTGPYAQAPTTTTFRIATAYAGNAALNNLAYVYFQAFR